MKNILLRPTFYLLVCFSITNLVTAQTTTSHSPYSQFGLGQLREDLNPQQRAMGGISTGVRYLSGASVLNIANPSSYSAMTRTIFDGSMYANYTELGKGGITDNTGDFAFGNITFGIPLKKAGGLSFGLVPFSDVGYNASTTRPLDTIQYRSSLTGEGGINKAYAGYGVSLPIKGVSVGANVGFLFGNLIDKQSLQFANNLGAYNTVRTETRSLRGMTVDYGAQYFRPIGKRMSITVGYSGSLNNNITNRSSAMVTINNGGLTSPEDNPVALDTVSLPTFSQRDIQLPLKHSIGFSISKGYNWTFGGDVNYADWSNFQTRSGEPNLGENKGFSLGGQFKPNPTSPKYLNIVDYRLGFRYNQTELTLNNKQIKDMAITGGFGFPLAPSNFGRTFSMVNITAEFGQRGTLSNNLVRERYINLHVGFTINDTWFIRRSID